jgi:hypothetical protein
LIDTGLPCEHKVSTTIQDGERKVVNQAFFEASKTLYLDKHGVLPGSKIKTRWWAEL